jgi:hypothetical protein
MAKDEMVEKRDAQKKEEVRGLEWPHGWGPEKTGVFRSIHA